MHTCRVEIARCFREAARVREEPSASGDVVYSVDMINIVEGWEKLSGLLKPAMKRLPINSAGECESQRDGQYRSPAAKVTRT